VAAIERARARGGRVVAVGTSVVRALEGSLAARGRLEAGGGVTALRIGPGFRPAIVTGVLTGMHEPGSTHLSLLAAFVPAPLLEAAYGHATRAGYLGHELGDASLVLCRRPLSRRASSGRSRRASGPGSRQGRRRALRPIPGAARRAPGDDRPGAAGRRLTGARQA
jgi:hypothetical protein